MALLIDGCLAAKEYLFEAFTGACMVIDGAFLRWIAPRLPEHACYSGAQIASSIQQLREASRRLGIAPVEPVDLFVEGNSELVVLEAAIGNAFHRDVNIIDMGGNTKLAWLRPRLELTRKQHRTAALILDRASRDIQNKVDALVAEGLLERDNVRFLPGDFEDIFEEELLLSVARRTLPEGMLAPTVDAIRDGEERRRQGFSRCLKKKALARGIDAGRMDSFVSSVKARMAEGIAEVVVESYHSFRQALTWRKGPRSARLRLVGFVHLCRWILKLAGKEARRKYLAASTS